MSNKLKLFTLSLCMVLSLITSQLSYGSEESYDEEVVTPNLQITNFPPEILEMILMPVVSCGKSPKRLADVNKEWNQLINDVLQKGSPIWDAWTGVWTAQDEKTYEIFRDMKLIYRPNPNSDEGMITLSIPKGFDPFRYTFDLKDCDNRAQHLVITNDLERFFTINENKFVVYFGPHFWVNKNIDSVSTPFNEIMNSWEAEQAPIGIFWRWGNSANRNFFDFLTSSSLSEMSLSNLGECHDYVCTRCFLLMGPLLGALHHLSLFSCRFSEPELDL